VAKSRDYISEIKAIQSNTGGAPRSFNLLKRLSQIIATYNALDKNQSELLRYFPISIVACTESFFREVVRDLVDHGDPYLANAAAKFSDIKINLKEFPHIHSKNITLGEWTAHTLKFNNLDDINSLITALLGEDFRGLLKSQLSNYDKKPLISDPSKVFNGVVKAYDMRHIFCHEYGLQYNFGQHEIEEACVASKEFLLATDLLISILTSSPDDGLPDYKKSQIAGEELENLTLEMQEIITNIQPLISKDEMLRLENAQKMWQQYLDAESLIFAGGWGGVTRAMFYQQRAIKVTKARIITLTGYYDQYLKNSQSLELSEFQKTLE
jgi:hypothetical protein